jgi:hypothetical protein
MFKRFFAWAAVGMFLLFTAGCNLIGIALGAAAAYGLSRIWTH